MLVGGCERQTAREYRVFIDDLDSARYVLPGTMDALVAQGRGAEIGTYLARLRNGPTTGETPEERYGLNYVGGSTPVHEATAQQLGYAAGCASAAFYRRSNVVRRSIGGDVETLAAALRALDPSLEVAVARRPFARLVVDGRDVAVGKDEARALEIAAYPTDSQGHRYSNIIGDRFTNAEGQCWSLPERP